MGEVEILQLVKISSAVFKSLFLILALFISVFSDHFFKSVGDCNVSGFSPGHYFFADSFDDFFKDFVEGHAPVYLGSAWKQR